MAIVKLVCQGCGANLDVLDNQRTFQCGYCGITNQISKTVHEQPAAPAQAPYVARYAPPPQVQNYAAPTRPPARSSAVGVFVLIMTLLPLVVGGAVAFFAFRTTTEVIDRVDAEFGGSVSTPGAEERKYRWTSSRPFIADVNGDGTADVIGLILLQSSQELILTAMSGTDWSTLWETKVDSRSEMPGQPKLRYEPQSQLVTFAIGTSLTAYDASTGTERWVSSFSDAIDRVLLDGDHLWVGTIDKRGSEVGLADGKLSAGEAEPNEAAVLLRADDGYDLIPKLRSMDLDAGVFSELRIQQGFCPEHEISDVGHRTYRCAHPRGLVFATRATGTQVPFLVGYDPIAKSESWRVQLTKPGTLETVESGFGQPRAELVGDAAVVSFVPNDKNPRIRRISLVDGSTAWEATLTQTIGSNVEGIAVAGERVLVRYGAHLHVLAFADGAELAVLGGW